MNTRHSSDVRQYLRSIFRSLPQQDELRLRSVLRKHMRSSGYRFIRTCICVLPFRTDTYRLESLLHLGWIAMRSDTRKNAQLSVIIHILAYRIWCFGLHHTSMSYCAHLILTFSEANARTERRAELFAYCVEHHYRSPLYGKILRHVLAAKLLHDDCHDIHHDIQKLSPHTVRQNKISSTNSSTLLDSLNDTILDHLTKARALAESCSLSISPLTQEFENASRAAFRLSQFQKGLLSTLAPSKKDL
jgi:hypothetical protein